MEATYRDSVELLSVGPLPYAGTSRIRFKGSLQILELSVSLLP